MPRPDLPPTLAVKIASRFAHLPVERSEAHFTGPQENLRQVPGMAIPLSPAIAFAAYLPHRGSPFGKGTGIP
jgi:hypothetical protein